MKRHDGPVSFVDQMIASHPPIAAKPITPGAGVDPNRVCKPSKRLRNRHRAARPGESLRSWVRGLVRVTLPTDCRHGIAKRWLASKGTRP